MSTIAHGLTTMPRCDTPLAFVSSSSPQQYCLGAPLVHSCRCCETATVLCEGLENLTIEATNNVETKRQEVMDLASMHMIQAARRLADSAEWSALLAKRLQEREEEVFWLRSDLARIQQQAYQYLHSSEIRYVEDAYTFDDTMVPTAYPVLTLAEATDLMSEGMAHSDDLVSRSTKTRACLEVLASTIQGWETEKPSTSVECDATEPVLPSKDKDATEVADTTTSTLNETPVLGEDASWAWSVHDDYSETGSWVWSVHVDGSETGSSSGSWTIEDVSDIVSWGGWSVADDISDLESREGSIDEDILTSAETELEPEAEPQATPKDAALEVEDLSGTGASPEPSNDSSLSRIVPPKIQPRRWGSLGLNGSSSSLSRRLSLPCGAGRGLLAPGWAIPRRDSAPPTPVSEVALADPVVPEPRVMAQKTNNFRRKASATRRCDAKVSPVSLESRPPWRY